MCKSIRLLVFSILIVVVICFIVDILVDRMIGLLVVVSVCSSFRLVMLVEVILCVMMLRFLRKLTVGIFYGDVN